MLRVYFIHATFAWILKYRAAVRVNGKSEYLQGLSYIPVSIQCTLGNPSIIHNDAIAIRHFYKVFDKSANAFESLIASSGDKYRKYTKQASG